MSLFTFLPILLVSSLSLVALSFLFTTICLKGFERARKAWQSIAERSKLRESLKGECSFQEFMEQWAIQQGVKEKTL